MILNMVGGGGGAPNGTPEFTYTGSYEYVDDGNKNWRLRFLTSGALTFTKLGNASIIDVFLVGGGGGGRLDGGGGGYTHTASIIPAINTGYPIGIGAGGNGVVGENASQAGPGGSTSAFGLSVYGGNTLPISGVTSTSYGGSGGGGYNTGTSSRGGYGGSDGGDGQGLAGYGQGTTTREFGEAAGALYAGGGAGASSVNLVGTGGAGGGGDGGTLSVGSAALGAPNTGGGGGGGTNSGGGGASGGSGIVIIRNHREAA